MYLSLKSQQSDTFLENTNQLLFFSHASYYIQGKAKADIYEYLYRGRVYYKLAHRQQRSPRRLPGCVACRLALLALRCALKRDSLPTAGTWEVSRRSAELLLPRVWQNQVPFFFHCKTWLEPNRNSCPGRGTESLKIVMGSTTPSKSGALDCCARSYTSHWGHLYYLPALV